MIYLILSLISACLGLILLNSSIIVFARAVSRGWLVQIPLEVRYIALLALILLIGLNASQWIAGNFVFALLSSVGLIVVVISVRKLTKSDRRLAIHDGFALLGVQVITLLGICAAFQMHSYWLLEGPNHDSLIYYQGMHWANDWPLFVGKESVRALWGLGVCGEGAGWIGFNCPLYRGGTYTVAAWIQYFAPTTSGNALYFIAAYAATIIWFSIRLLPESVVGQVTPLRTGVMSLTVTFSTGIIGALVNSNLATVLGAASLVAIIPLAMRTDLLPSMRFGLMAAWCAVAGHFYAESIFYIGLFIGLLFIFELPHLLKILDFTGVMRLCVIIILITFVLGNISIGQAFASLFMFAEMPKDGGWFSWYLHQPLFFWSGSFIAGLLMGGGKPSASIVIFAAMTTLVAVVNLLTFRQTRNAVIALICTSFFAVLYIVMTKYQYGEHKIVHLMGPAWALLLVVSTLRLLGRIDMDDFGRSQQLITKVAGWGSFLCLVLISAGFFFNALKLLHHLRGLHGIDFGLNILASHIRPGDKVLLDDTSWVGVEKFHNSHYMIFKVHHQGAKILLPSISSDPLRGGYFRGSRHDSFSQADGVDWLIQSRGHLVPASKFTTPEKSLVWENNDYRLHNVGKAPLAVAGNGWYDCEITHCWTSADFEIETFVPIDGNYKLIIDFDIFQPPKVGIITVRGGNGQVLGKWSLPREQIHIQVPQGWSRLVFNSDWPITSPEKLGMSPDGRLLFAAIKKVELKPFGEHQEK